MLNNEDRQFIEENIKELLEFINSKKSLQMPLETDNDFMTLMCELMGAIDWLFQSACMFSNVNGLNRDQAILTGHLIRIRKLYRGMRIHASKNQLELAIVFHRLIFETIAYMAIPSPKIVGARSPRPDENRADASAPPSLQGGRSLNIGRGNPAPTQPRRESYLKRLPHTPEGLFIDEMLEHHGAMGCIQDTSIQLKCR